MRVERDIHLDAPREEIWELVSTRTTTRASGTA